MSKNESWDPIWEKVFAENPWGKYPGESIIRFVARNFYRLNRPDVRILEVGCGPGANIWYLAKEKFAAYGIDGSHTAIRQAGERLSSEGLQADLRVGDIIELPYEENSFDAVLDAECLYANDINSTRKILDNIRRVMKPKGLFYSRTLSEKIYLGKTWTELGNKCYTNISDGPLANRGFARLMDEQDIHSLYGEFFDILSVDTLDFTSDNQQQTISEYIIVSQKK